MNSSLPSPHRHPYFPQWIQVLAPSFRHKLTFSPKALQSLSTPQSSHPVMYFQFSSTHCINRHPSIQALEIRVHLSIHLSISLPFEKKDKTSQEKAAWPSEQDSKTTNMTLTHPHHTVSHTFIHSFIREREITIQHRRAAERQTVRWSRKRNLAQSERENTALATAASDIPMV